MGNLSALKEELRKLLEQKIKITTALRKVNNTNICALNSNGSFAYIASEANMNTYWNTDGKSNIQTEIREELLQIDKDFTDLSSISSTLKVKAEEKIKNLDIEIESLRQQIAELEAEQSE